jgi:hypothetical protein
VSVTREQVITILVERDQRDPFTTTDIAQALQVEEYAVRAAISWLCVCGILAPVGATKRIDRVGRLYDAATYQWNGQTFVPRVRRSKQEREATKSEWDRTKGFGLDCFNVLMGLGKRGPEGQG